MMNVLLINPPTTHNIRSHVPENIADLAATIPPLGILYLAAACKKEHAVSIIDSLLLDNSYERLEEHIRKSQPDVVGITTPTATLIDSIKTARIVKKIFPSAKIVLGGAHITIYPKESMFDCIDYTMTGECEYTFPQLLKAIDTNTGFKDIKGLSYRQGDEIISNPMGEFIDDLDALEFPARDLIDNSQYYSVLSSKKTIATMITSRGCPFHCVYCDRNNNGRKFRARSPKNVVDEMEECQKLGVSEIFFIDDTFTISKPRVIEICKEILRRKLTIDWDVRSRINTIDEEMLRYMKQAGVTRIYYGIESGSPKVLKAINKEISLERTVEIVKETKRLGIGVLGYFMIGCPGETYKDFMKTVRFACSLPLDYAQFSITVPYPSTPLYTQSLEEKLYAEDYWKKFAHDPTGDFVSPYYTKNFTEKQLIEMCNKAHHMYYSRPSYIFRSLLKIRSFADLMIKVKAGLRVFGFLKQ